MSEAKFTKGPWQAGRADMASIVDGVDSKWIYAKDEYVAIASGRVTGTWDTVMVNSHLIAAAPELYEAWEVLFASYKSLADSGDAGFWKIEDQPEGKQALAALAKACGETL